MMNLLLEWTSRDAPSTRPGRDKRVFRRRSVIMWHILAVPGHAILGAVEYGRIDRIVDVVSPVPVGLISFISTFVSKSLFVCPGEITVPCKEVSLYKRC